MTTVWERLDALRREAKDLETKLKAIGWTLIEPHNGCYRARKIAALAGVWRLAEGKTPDDVMAAVQAEIQRHSKGWK